MQLHWLVQLHQPCSSNVSLGQDSRIIYCIANHGSTPILLVQFDERIGPYPGALAHLAPVQTVKSHHWKSLLRKLDMTGTLKRFSTGFFRNLWAEKPKEDSQSVAIRENCKLWQRQSWRIDCHQTASMPRHPSCANH